MTCQKVVSKSLVLNRLNWVHILRSVITVFHQGLSLTFPNNWFSWLKIWPGYDANIIHSTLFDVGDLPELTFGNRVLKTGVIKWPLKLYGHSFLHFKDFPETKKHDFLRFVLSCCTRFLERRSSAGCPDIGQFPAPQIDICCPRPSCGKPDARRCRLLSTGQTDGGRTPRRYTDAYR